MRKTKEESRRQWPCTWVNSTEYLVEEGVVEGEERYLDVTVLLGHPQVGALKVVLQQAEGLEVHKQDKVQAPGM